MHAANAPGRISEEENIAAQTFDGEVFVHGADHGAFRLGDDGVERVIRNRAAAGDGGEAAAAASAEAMIDLIAMQVGAVAPAARGDAIGKHRDDFVEIVALEIAIRKRAAHEREEIVFLPIFGGAGGHDLLRENVQRSFGNFDAVEFAVADGANQRGAFQKLIARGGEKAAFGNRAAPVAGAADALQRDGNRARRADLADQIDGADINSEFERRGGDERANFAGFEFGFDGEAADARKAAVMRGDRIFAEQRGEMMRHAFGEPARIHENQRRAMLLHETRRCAGKFRPTFRWRRRGRVRWRALRWRDRGDGAARFRRLRARAGRCR